MQQRHKEGAMLDAECVIGDGRLPERAYVVLGYVGRYPDGVHGYRLGRILSRSPEGLALRLGQLYRLLHHLERAGCVESKIETGGPRPARYRFTMTREGRARFRRWLTSLPKGGGPIREHVLDRLRFSECLPSTALQRLLAEARRECENQIDSLRREGVDAAARGSAGKPLHAMALEARLAADKRWLDEVRALADQWSRCAAAGAVPVTAVALT
jgi:DNA-binding PadR family transcriptional regulator